MILNYHHCITVQIRYSQRRLDIFIYSRQHRVCFSRSYGDIFWNLLVNVIKNNRLSQPSDILVYLSLPWLSFFGREIFGKEPKKVSRVAEQDRLWNEGKEEKSTVEQSFWSMLQKQPAKLSRSLCHV